MKTLKEAQRYHDQLHYRLPCEYCNTECVIDETDFSEVYGLSKPDGGDVRFWKCPVCGHINKEPIESLSYGRCNEWGLFYYGNLHEPILWN